MTEPTQEYINRVNAVVRAAAVDDAAELYPCRLGVFCDRCEDTFEADFIVSTEMTPAERLAVVRRHVVTVRGWRCDKTGDFCKHCLDMMELESRVQEKGPFGV